MYLSYRHVSCLTCLNGWLQSLVTIGMQSGISQFIALLAHDYQQGRNTAGSPYRVVTVLCSKVVSHSLVLSKEDTSPINTYIKLVTASPCYFCFPEGKTLDQNQQHHKQPAKEVLLQACVHAFIYAHSCVYL